MLTSKFDLYKREWLDLVFADRNKAYGAYDLRVHHGDYVLRALAIAMVGFTATFITVSLLSKPDVIQQQPKKYTFTDVAIPKIKPQIEKPVEAKLKAKTATQHKTEVKPAAAPLQTVATQQFKQYKPSNDANTVEPVKIEDLTKAIGPVTTEGEGKTHDQNVSTDSGSGGSGTASAGENTTVFDSGSGVLDRLPEPLGGSGAWSKFLQKNLRYPSTENQGRVTISFVVEKDGHLTDITVLRGVSPELDNEAVRVLKLSPAWKPGMQNGRPVRVKFTVPIVFQLTEQ